MHKLVLSVMAGAVALGAAVPSQAMNVGPFRGGANTTNSVGRILAAHNRERARVGSPPLIWDQGLAQAAASYGPALARMGALRHSAKASRPGQRENLWMGTRGYFSPEQMVGAWVSERNYMRGGVYPAVSRTGRWEDVSHYTQLIWPTTTRVGCAIYSSAASDFLICRYSPPGNVDGVRLSFR